MTQPPLISIRVYLSRFRLLVSNPHLEENDIRNVRIPIYFRQKLPVAVSHKATEEDGNEAEDGPCCNEFEMMFSRPATGTECGSGTVGGAMILSEERAQEMLPQVVILTLLYSLLYALSLHFYAHL